MSKTHDKRQAHKRPLPPANLRPIREVSALTGITSSTLRRWAREGRITATRFGSKVWYVDPDEAGQLSRTLKPGRKPTTL